ncbi:hypothetical protein FA13DRAFT_1292591 [Coprinellus micaceus]|uniref:Uncharacterized protein n=1 Tax=Coprinellus micaceus TaxID=71717 RepID=A0A4Y7STS3_COPMI|nr:hypothetical protein FA13DRAFT_1292591 [Coprinellus micaceus]
MHRAINGIPSKPTQVAAFVFMTTVVVRRSHRDREALRTVKQCSSGLLVLRDGAIWRILPDPSSYNWHRAWQLKRPESAWGGRLDPLSTAMWSSKAGLTSTWLPTTTIRYPSPLAPRSCGRGMTSSFSTCRFTLTLGKTGSITSPEYTRNPTPTRDRPASTSRLYPNPSCSR